jgi:hypothetical protein
MTGSARPKCAACCLAGGEWAEAALPDLDAGLMPFLAQSWLGR